MVAGQKGERVGKSMIANIPGAVLSAFSGVYPDLSAFVTGRRRRGAFAV